MTVRCAGCKGMDMKHIKIGGSDLKTSAIAFGCMRISGMPLKDVSRLIDTALENGINLFDHADIYGGGRSEEVFAKAAGMCPTVREKMFLQSKCGIGKGMYDLSKKYILQSVDGILKRLDTEYLDLLLLHRPDTLMEPEEISEAFNYLNESGKVRYFGVSNQNSMQIRLLEKYLRQPILVNQLQLSLAHTSIIDAGLNVNLYNDAAIVRDGSILEYCRLNGITIQTWSSLQYGFFEGTFLNNEKFVKLNRVINRMAEEKSVTDTAIAIAWLLRHPAGIQPIVGTTKCDRVVEVAKAAEIELSREEWYELYLAAGNKLP